jgi:hypothetical protein
MMMSLKNLLNRLIREGKLKRQETDITYVQSLLEEYLNFCTIAIRDGRASEDIFEIPFFSLTSR